ncbi:MAG: PfkB family carbohydrate kinase [Pseudomonadota bacterium]
MFDINPGGVVVVGGMNLDVLATAGHNARADDSTPGSVRFLAGGVGRNIAESLTRLKVNCCLHSAIADDVAGDQLLRLCNAAKMTTDRVVRIVGRTTPVYVAVNQSGGDLLHAVSDMSLLDSLCADDLPALAADIQHSAFCVVDANLPESLITHIVIGSGTETLMVAEAVSVSKCRRLAAVLPALHLLKVNHKEAATLAGLDESLPSEALARALLALGPSGVLMTLGAQGVLFATVNNGSVSVAIAPAPITQLVSVNGAGDNLLAGFLAARLAGYGIEQQLSWGVEAARLSLQSFSACSDQLSLEHMQHYDE